MITLTPAVSSPGAAMAHKAAREDRPSEGKQINFRAGPDLVARLERTAGVIGVEVSGLVRLVLHRYLHVYEEQAAQILRERQQGG